jgi:hypothetical protein
MAKTATRRKPSLDLLSAAPTTAQAVAQAAAEPEIVVNDGALITLEEPKPQVHNTPADRLFAENIMLKSQMEAIRDARDDAQASLLMVTAERDMLQVRLAEFGAEGEPPFDPTKAYELRVDFNGLVGPGQHLSYPRGTYLTDAYVLNLLHAAGADLKRA